MSDGEAPEAPIPPPPAPPGRAHPAAALRRAWGRLHPRTLRSRLVLSVVALVAVVGAIVSLASGLVLHGYLMQRLDDQLGFAARRGAAVVSRHPDQPPVASLAVAAVGQSPGTFGAVVRGGSVVDKRILTTRPHPSPERVSVDAPRRLAALPADGEPHTVDLGGTLGEYRLTALGIPDGTLVIGLPLSEVSETVSRLIGVLLLASGIAVVVAAFAGLLIVRLALRPLDRVVSTAGRVTRLPLDRGDVALSVRVPDADPRTEVGRVGGALNGMLEHVAGALRARQESEDRVRTFVADASHELRTPLASIRGYSELTRRSGEELPADAVHALGRIESESERMTALVEDLLLLARLDAGRDLERQSVDLSSLLVDAVSDAHAAGREHVFALDLPEEPVLVDGDAARLHQVVANLLANARVHTPPGTTVTASLRAEGQNDPGPDGPPTAGRPAPRRARVTIADDGPGIPAEQRERLFERFARGDASRSRATGSTGLGLAIVKAVVDAHGGTVEVASEPGATAFTVRLPLDAP